MTEQLHKTTQILDENNISYWLDSGTLLGIMRDGKLLEHDLDIDIGIWREDLPKLVDLVSLFKSDGFRFRKKSYRGDIYQCDFIPQDQRRKVNVLIYRETDAQAWCPASKLKLNNPHSPGDVQYYIRGLPRHVLYLFNQRVEHHRMSQYPWNYLYDIKTYVVPARYFREQEQYGDFFVPSNSVKYLKYKFGDWRNEKPDWKYWFDDRSLQSITPSDLPRY